MAAARTLAASIGYDIDPTGRPRELRDHGERAPPSTALPAVYGGDPYAGGVDLNGDGDMLDTVTILNPSQTRTRRYAVIAGLATTSATTTTSVRRSRTTIPTTARPVKSGS